MLVLLAMPILASAQAGPGAKAPPVGWIELFDGRSLAGWTEEQGAQWRVSAGEIVGDAGADGWLRSDRQFADFILRIEFKNSPKGNSGLFFRTTKESNPADPSNPLGGYELQINNDDDKWATGSIENFIQRLLPVSPAPDRWHSYRLEVRGDHLVATLDGTKVLDGHDSKFSTGYLGLQHHKDNAIGFRSITIQAVR
jgi:hypothetical protein